MNGIHIKLEERLPPRLDGRRHVGPAVDFSLALKSVAPLPCPTRVRGNQDSEWKVPPAGWVTPPPVDGSLPITITPPPFLHKQELPLGTYREALIPNQGPVSPSHSLDSTLPQQLTLKFLTWRPPGLPTPAMTGLGPIPGGNNPIFISQPMGQTR